MTSKAKWTLAYRNARRLVKHGELVRQQGLPLGMEMRAIIVAYQEWQERVEVMTLAHMEWEAANPPWAQSV